MASWGKRIAGKIGLSLVPKQISGEGSKPIWHASNELEIEQARGDVGLRKASSVSVGSVRR